MVKNCRTELFHRRRRQSAATAHPSWISFRSCTQSSSSYFSSPSRVRDLRQLTSSPGNTKITPVFSISKPPLSKCCVISSSSAFHVHTRCVVACSQLAARWRNRHSNRRFSAAVRVPGFFLGVCSSCALCSYNFRSFWSSSKRAHTLPPSGTTKKRHWRPDVEEKKNERKKKNTHPKRIPFSPKKKQSGQSSWGAG